MLVLLLVLHQIVLFGQEVVCQVAGLRVHTRLFWLLEHVIKLLSELQLFARNLHVLIFFVLKWDRGLSADLLAKLREALPVELLTGRRLVEVFLNDFVWLLLE